MPLSEDDFVSKEPDGAFNEDYCKWCYVDGNFVYPTKEALISFLLEHMPNPDQTPQDVRRQQYDDGLSQLKHWKA